MGLRRLLTSSRDVLLFGGANIVVALLFAILSLFSPSWPLLVQLQAFSGYALFAGLFGLLALPALWAAQRSAALVAAGLILASLTVLSPPVFSAYLGHTPDPVADGTSISLMSLNMKLGEADPEEVLERAQSVDVLALSEITPKALADLEIAGLRKTFRYSVGTADPDARGTMVFARQQITGERLPYMVFGNYLVAVGGVKILVAHPAAPVSGLDWAGEHRLLRAVVEAEKPALLVGDLNANQYHHPLKDLNELGYRDASELLNQGMGNTWPANGLFPILGLLPPTVAIDHALISPAWTATEEEIFTVSGTDHRGLTVTFTERK